jgi:hypothetical protein
VDSNLIGIIVGGVIGVAGLLAGWLNLREGNKHEATMAREAREQERLGSAYVPLLRMAERMGQWAHLVAPMIEFNPPQPIPPLPDLAEQAEVAAVVKAYGSDATREVMDKWLEIVRKIVMAVQLVGFEREARERGEGGNFGQPYLKLMDLRPAEAETRDALARQVAAELRAVAKG